jgi:hypothetical protein
VKPACKWAIRASKSWARWPATFGKKKATPKCRQGGSKENSNAKTLRAPIRQIKTVAQGFLLRCSILGRRHWLVITDILNRDGERRASAGCAFERQMDQRRERPCCSDQRYGRVSPSPCSSSDDADRVRASKRKHAVQNMSSNVHFCRAAFIRVRAQPVTDDLLVARHGRLGAGAQVVS